MPSLPVPPPAEVGEVGVPFIEGDNLHLKVCHERLQVISALLARLAMSDNACFHSSGCSNLQAGGGLHPMKEDFCIAFTEDDTHEGAGVDDQWGSPFSSYIQASMSTESSTRLARALSM